MKEKCICCGKLYISQGAAIDFAKCFECNWSEDSQLIRRWKKKVVLATNKKVRPDYLGKDLLNRIRIFFCNNHGILWQRKFESYKLINREFGLDLTKKEIESIINNNTLRTHNLQKRNV